MKLFSELFSKSNRNLSGTFFLSLGKLEEFRNSIIDAIIADINMLFVKFRIAHNQPQKRKKFHQKNVCVIQSVCLDFSFLVST